MYTMKEACEKTNLPYETLKYYCNQGLVPNVKRDSLVEQLKQVQECIDYIDWKQSFYDDVLSGKTQYYSNLIDTEK